MRIAPVFPAGALAGLSPAQRAQMQAMMSAVTGALSAPIVTQMCITAEDLQRGFSADPGGDAENCTHKLLSNTGSVVEVELTCTGDHPMTGTIHYQATSDTAVAGHMEMATTMGGNPVNMSRAIDGQWLADDCGDVKPMGQQ